MSPARAPNDPTTSIPVLQQALEEAPDLASTWGLLQEWRKRRSDLVDAAASHIRHWDQGLVFFIIEAGYGRAIKRALENPSWPLEWADGAAINWAMASLASEAAQESLGRACSVLKALQRAGRFNAASFQVDRLVQSLDGRKRMNARHMSVASLLLDLQGLSVEVYNHIASVAIRAGIPDLSLNRSRYTELGLMNSLLNHPHATKEWVDLIAQSIPPERADHWNRSLGYVDKWKGKGVGILPIQEVVPDRIVAEIRRVGAHGRQP